MNSGNKKTGFMPVSTSHKGTCPDACPFKGKGCYARSGPLAFHWSKVTDGSRGTDWKGFLSEVKKIGKGELFRHNQAGDLVGENDVIDRVSLMELAKASKKIRAYSYTHYPLTPENVETLKMANDAGFTVNASTNNISEVDKAMENGLPVVTVLPYKKDGYNSRKLSTEKGNTVLICPASMGTEITCKTCTLCQNKNRSYAIGFIAHGSSKKGLGE